MDKNTTEWYNLPSTALIRICCYSNGTSIFNKLRLVCKNFYTKLYLHNDIKKIYLDEQYIYCEGNMIRIMFKYLFELSNGFFIWYMRFFGLQIDRPRHSSSYIADLERVVNFVLYLISNKIMIMNEETKTKGFQGIYEKHIHVIENLYYNSQMIRQFFIFRKWLLQYYVHKEDKIGVMKMYKIYAKLHNGMHEFATQVYGCGYEAYNEEFLLWLVKNFRFESTDMIVKFIASSNQFKKVLEIYIKENPSSVINNSTIYLCGHYKLLKYIFNKFDMRKFINSNDTYLFVDCLYRYYKKNIDKDKLFAQWSYDILINEFHIDSNEILHLDVFYIYCLQYDCIDFLKKHIKEFREWVKATSEIKKFHLFRHINTKDGIVFLLNESNFTEQYFRENLGYVLRDWSSVRQIDAFFDFYGEPDEYTMEMLLSKFFHLSVTTETMLNFLEKYSSYITLDMISHINWSPLMSRSGTFNFIYKKFGKKKIWVKTISLPRNKCDDCGHEKYDYTQFYNIYKRIGFNEEIIDYLNLQLETEKCDRCMIEILRILCLCEYNRGAKKIKLRLDNTHEKIKRMCSVIGIVTHD